MALVANFGPVVSALLQQGFLERQMQEGLDSILAYRRLVNEETIPGRIGEILTRTRKGRLAPNTTPRVPSSMNGSLDNGLTPSSWTTEQYQFILSEYADTQDLNIMQEQAAIADMFLANAKNNGVAAAQSLERILRKRLFDAYLGGNTRIIAYPGNVSNGGASSFAAVTAGNTINTNVNFEDLRGLRQIVPTSGASQGQLVAPSATNQLFATVYQGTNRYRIAFEAAPVDYTYSSGSALTITNSPEAQPGFYTTGQIRYVSPIAPTTGNYTPATGDVIICENAPLIIRPRSLTHHSQIVAADVFTMALIEDGIAYLRDNGVPPMEDGNYAIICDNTSMRQIMGDPDFKLLYQGTKVDSTAYGKQQVISILGATFYPTTEAYVQSSPALGVVGPRIRRPIIAGADCAMQGNFEGMDSWLRNRGLDESDDTVVMIDGIVQVVREPLDRLKQNVAMSWTWIGDFAVPSDVTANTTIIPTASSSMFKRCVVIEHAG